MSKPIFVYGLHTVAAVLQRQPASIHAAKVLQGARAQPLKRLIATLQEQGIAYEECPRSQLDKLCQHGNHQGILLYCEPTTLGNEKALSEFLQSLSCANLLILDGVQDPHNLGACLRTADAAGVQGVILPKDKSCSITPTVRKIACGACEYLPIFRVTNLARTCRLLKDYGFWLYGTAADANDSLYAIDWAEKSALVLGGEGHGLRQLTARECDYHVRIPMSGAVASLNVSVAAGVSLFEMRRQQMLAQG